MKIKTLPNGNLEMRASWSDRIHIEIIIRKHGDGMDGERVFVRRMLPGYQLVKPEDVGALTSATLIQDKAGNVYSDMDYQVSSFLQTLAVGKPVIWTCGGTRGHTSAIRIGQLILEPTT